MLANSLAGIQVIDFTQVAAGPTCSLMLADLGADVVKIEAPTGDICRALAPHVGGESVFFMALNGNKRGVVLDLKQQQDRDVALRLCVGADVVLESFRPGVMDRFGLGAEHIAARNPRAIYCSISGFGQSGPWKDLPGVDGVLQALSGLMSVNGPAGAAPSKMQVPVVDVVTGYLATIAVLAALCNRAVSAKGRYLDVSMFSSALMLQHGSLASFLATREVPGPIGSAAPYSAPNEAVRCADGWIMLAAYHPHRWQSLCRVVGAPELAVDSRFANLQARIDNRVALVAALEERMQSGTVASWQALFREADIICGSICDYAQLERSAQFQSLGVPEQMEHPNAGLLHMPRFLLAQAAGVAKVARRPSPTLGQHTAEVLAEMRARGTASTSSNPTVEHT